MALLRGLAKFQAMRNLLGFDEDPLQDVKSIQQIRSSQQTRDLAERKFRYDQGRDQQKDYFDRTKFVFTQLASVYSSTPEGDPRREYLRQMTENFKFALPKDMQLALGATELLRSISPEERRRTEWRRANPRPKATVGADGQPLPWNEENADTIAGDKLRAAKWEYFDKTVAFGVETGKVISPPRSWLSPPVGEGAEGGPGPRRFYFNHEDTDQLMSMEISTAGLGVSLEQAKKWDWTPQRMATEDFEPSGPPMTGIFGGTKIQRTPGRSLRTGKNRWNDEIYGQPDSAIKDVPGPWKDALGFMAQGKKFDDKKITNGEVAKVMQVLQELEGKYSKKELEQNVALVEQEISKLYPSIPYAFSFIPGAMKRPWVFGRNKYIVEGTSWVVAPKMRAVTVTDGVGNIGKLNVDDKGKAHDKNKTAIEEVTVPVEDGDIIEDITFKHPYQPRTAGEELKAIQQKYRQVIETIGKGLEATLEKRKREWKKLNAETGITWEQFVTRGYK